MTHDRIPLWLSDDLERDLRLHASATGTSITALVEDVLRRYVRARSASSDREWLASDDCPLDACPSGDDRRACCRHRISLPAVVHTTEQDGRTGRYRVAQLRDISATGIGLRFEGEDRDQFDNGREFEVLFQLAEQASPLHIVCTACRKALDGAGVIIGAIFKDHAHGLDEQLSALV